MTEARRTDVASGDPPAQTAAQVMERLARRLVDEGHLTQDAMEELDHRVKWLNEPLDHLLRKEERIPESLLLETLSDITGMSIVDLSDVRIGDDAVRRVPAKVATHYHVIPLYVEAGTLTVATSHVHDVREADHLRMLLDCPIRWVLAKHKEIDECIKHYYGVAVEAYIDAGLAGRVGGEEGVAGEPGTASDESRHVLAFARRIIEDAIRSDATDVHIEPYEDNLRLRYRIDGVLYPVPLPQGAERYQRAIVSSIKVMAQLNIAEHRLPQDGAFALETDGRSFDLRVSILPSRHGETANLRILNRTTVFLSMEQLGLRSDQLEIMKRIMSEPYGVVLFTGATGSGKTTSLYAALAWLNDTERKIITIEDPIEYQIPGITQMQVQPGIGFTFASGLRSVLRHDPDVILIGEIRDTETANIAISAAMTGHLVFSTLHTNDSPGGLLRLVEMGVEPYLVASSVQAMVAQRLVRRVCESCRESAEIDPRVLEDLHAQNPELARGADFSHGRGCPACRFTGYSGRKAVFEVLVMDDDIRALVVGRASSREIMQRAKASGLVTLRQGAWSCALEGITTVDDVLRVTRRA